MYMLLKMLRRKAGTFAHIGTLTYKTPKVNITWMSAADVTLEAQSDKSDILRSSGSSLERGNLYWNSSFPSEAVVTEAPC